MLTVQSRLVFGLIKGIIVGVFKLIFKIIELFSLHFAMIVLIFGGALYLSGAWYSSLALQLIFYFLLIAALVYAIISTVRRLLGLGKKKKSGDGSATASKDKKCSQP